MNLKLKPKPLSVLNRDNWTCQLCGKPTPAELRGLIHPDAPEIDHIVPRSRGGTNAIENLRCLCRSCNQEKASFFDYEYKSVYAEDDSVVDMVSVLIATENIRDGGRKGGRATSESTNGRKSNGGKRFHELYPGANSIHKWVKDNQEKWREGSSLGNKRMRELYADKISGWMHEAGKKAGKASYAKNKDNWHIRVSKAGKQSALNRFIRSVAWG